MKLWHIWQSDNSNYDSYDSAVVAAETEKEAQYTHPSEYVWRNNNWCYHSSITDSFYEGDCGTWTHPSKVKVEYIGEAVEGTEAGVIVASFNAG